MSSAIYAGSFDPFTVGHLDILSRALDMFDQVHVVVASNPGKDHMFSAADRVNLVIHGIKALPREYRERVRVFETEDYVYKYAQEKEIRHFVRGIRNGIDLEYEVGIQEFNWKVAGIDTVYFTPLQYIRVSSTMIRQYLKAEQYDLAIEDMPSSFKTAVGRKILLRMVGVYHE